MLGRLEHRRARQSLDRRRLRRLDAGVVEGLTAREKGKKAVDLATTIASAENPDGKTAQVQRDPPRGERSRRARRGSFLCGVALRVLLFALLQVPLVEELR